MVLEKTPPAQFAMGETTVGARGVFVPTAEGETPPPEVAAGDYHRKHKVQKARTSISASRNEIQQQHATTNNQHRISTGAGGVHDAAIIAACVREHIKGRAWKELELCALTQVAMIAASCTPPALVLILRKF